MILNLIKNSVGLGFYSFNNYNEFIYDTGMILNLTKHFVYT